MPKINRSQKREYVRPAKLIGVGAFIVSTLAGCSNASNPSPTPASATAIPATIVPSAPSQNNAAASTTAPQAEPSATPVPATAEATTEATQAPDPTQVPTQAAPTQVPTEAPTAAAAPAGPAGPAAPAQGAAASGKFKDGEYTGDPVPADRWGNIQVKATIQGGQLVKIDILSFPHSTRRSDLISHAAIPQLIDEAVQNQTAQVDVISRATDTSFAFTSSLESALSAAANGNH